MVEVDVFWSYGIGAGFAMGAGRQLLARSEQPAASSDPALARRLARADAGPGERPGFMGLLEYRRMVYNLLFLALLFAPSGIVLLWGHANWETMQIGDKSMPAWLIALFAITNVTQGILGFWVVERLIAHRRGYLAYLQVILGYFGMFFILVHGWDGRGWQRFFTTDKHDFANWPAHSALYHVTHWLTSDVALTLYAMGIVMIPIMLVLTGTSLTEGYRLGGRYAITGRAPGGFELLVLMGATMLFAPLGLAIAASLVIHGAQSVVGTAAGTPIGVLACALLAWPLALSPRTGLLHWIYVQLWGEGRLPWRALLRPVRPSAAH